MLVPCAYIAILLLVDKILTFLSPLPTLSDGPAPSAMAHCNLAAACAVRRRYGDATSTHAFGALFRQPETVMGMFPRFRYI
jgi:hypothetical protein